MSSTPRQRERLAKAQGGICRECGLPLPEDPSATEVDHIIPRSSGGPDAAWNKRLVHPKCNRSKRTKLTAEAKALAKKHGVALHIPLGDTHLARYPRTWSDSLFTDYLCELDRIPITDTARREAAGREYLDTRRYLDGVTADLRRSA